MGVLRLFLFLLYILCDPYPCVSYTPGSWGGYYCAMVLAKQTRNVIVTFSIGFKLVTLNLTFGKRLANVYVLCRHIFDV